MEVEAAPHLKKWTRLDQTLTADGKIISLEEHDGSYAIRLDGAMLMSTRQHASEESLAELVCAHLKGRRGARVLIGGLGFGFTLRAALSALAADATVVVAEVLNAVIVWNREPSFHLAADAMADHRVTVLNRDIGELIREARGSFDSIILDVDNGPSALSADGNSRLYDSAGLRASRAALRPNGCLAVWSVAPDPAFESRMGDAGFVVELRTCRSRQKSGRRHTLFLGRAN